MVVGRLQIEGLTWGSTTSLFRSDAFSCVAFLFFFFTFNFSLSTQKAGCTCTSTIESQKQKANPDMPYATPMQSQHGPLMQVDWFLTDFASLFHQLKGADKMDCGSEADDLSKENEKKSMI